MHPMHPAHQEFVSRPVFCKLDDFFYLLDQMEVTDRHMILAYLYPDAFHTMNVKTPPGITTHPQAYQYSYEQFKDWCRGMVQQTTVSFTVFPVVSIALAWACRNSDEKVVSGLIESNENEKRKAQKDFKQGKIDKQQLADIEAHWDAQIASHPQVVKENKRRYEWFCVNVVDRLPRDDPA